MRDGLIGEFTVEENLMLADYRKAPFARFGFLRDVTTRHHCSELVSAFQVKTPSLETPARNLSGGNIQKLILARELSGHPRVLLVAQPTRGVDVGAAEYIHRRLIEQRAEGTAILIVSEDLDEVLALGLMMAGVRPEGEGEREAEPAASAEGRSSPA